MTQHKRRNTHTIESLPPEGEGPAGQWARLRFAVVGPLLASPPGKGQLQAALKQLAKQTWRHPISNEPVQFSRSTIERWFYVAHGAPRDPVDSLRPRVRRDKGSHPSILGRFKQTLEHHYEQHPGWSVQLHYDNLVAVERATPEGLAVPSYSAVRRYMRAHGMRRVRPESHRATPGAERAAKRLERLEVRSFEVTHVHGLWHLDFHSASRKIVTSTGHWCTPLLLGILDDRSRLCCHLQWYLDETAEALIHGLSQAIQKRALPRALMTDNGSAMVAAETTEGLLSLGIIHETTLPASPYQNGKQESFWAQVEGRLMPMLERVSDLTLDLLNTATQAWVELEYNKQKVHRELGVPPLCRYLEGPDVGRESPSSEALRGAFRQTVRRRQRRSDGTISLAGQRFEVPSRFRQVQDIFVRYARWDLGHVDLVDPRTNTTLAAVYPQDKSKNADGRRRQLEPLESCVVQEPLTRSGVPAPLLAQLIADYASTGLPPAYLPKPSPPTDCDPEINP